VDLPFSTLSGTAGGDPSPATLFATILACIEAMTGQVYRVVVIARLVGLQVVSPPVTDVEGIA
jgi:hypothetical protein